MNDNQLCLAKLQFEEKVVSHVSALLRTAVRLCRNRHVAEDLVQETVLSAWKAFQRSQEVKNHKAWLFAIMLHRWARERRTRVHEALTGADEMVIVLSKRGARPANAEQSLLLREILERIDALPEEQRTVLLLAVVEDIPLRDIAKMLRVPLGTVFSRLGRARAALRLCMSRSEKTRPAAAGGMK